MVSERIEGCANNCMGCLKSQPQSRDFDKAMGPRSSDDRFVSIASPQEREEVGRSGGLNA